MKLPAFPIATARLLLRPMTESDWDDYKAYQSLPSSYRYLLIDMPDEVEMRAKFDRMMNVSFTTDGDTLRLGVALKTSGKMIGQVPLTITNLQSRQAEIGYIFNPDVAGLGYASEAAAAMMALGFDHFGFHRIVARLDAQNTASRRICERLGMRQEAHFRQNYWLKGQWTDELVFARLRDEPPMK